MAREAGNGAGSYVRYPEVVADSAILHRGGSVAIETKWLPVLAGVVGVIAGASSLRSERAEKTAAACECSVTYTDNKGRQVTRTYNPGANGCDLDVTTAVRDSVTVDPRMVAVFDSVTVDPKGIASVGMAKSRGLLRLIVWTHKR